MLSFLLQAPSLWDTLIYSYEFTLTLEFGCFGASIEGLSFAENQSPKTKLCCRWYIKSPSVSSHCTPKTLHLGLISIPNFPESPLLSPWHHWWALLLDHSHGPRSADLDPNGWELRCQNSRSFKGTSWNPHLFKKVWVWPVWHSWVWFREFFVNYTIKKLVLFFFMNFSFRSNRPFHRALGFFSALLVILPSGSLITQDKMGILHWDENGLIVLIPATKPRVSQHCRQSDTNTLVFETR